MKVTVQTPRAILRRDAGRVDFAIVSQGVLVNGKYFNHYGTLSEAEIKIADNPRGYTTSAIRNTDRIGRDGGIRDCYSHLGRVEIYRRNIRIQRGGVSHLYSHSGTVSHHVGYSTVTTLHIPARRN